jgi:hypothetical protein
VANSPFKVVIQIIMPDNGSLIVKKLAAAHSDKGLRHRDCLEFISY